MSKDASGIGRLKNLGVKGKNYTPLKINVLVRDMLYLKLLDFSHYFFVVVDASMKFFLQGPGFN